MTVYIFLISKCRRVLNVVFFLLGDSLASEFYVPTFRNTLFHLHRRCKQGACSTYVNETVCSETSAHKIQTPENHPKERIQQFISYLVYRYKGKGKAIPLQAWTGPEGSRRLRLPDFKTIGT